MKIDEDEKSEFSHSSWECNVYHHQNYFSFTQQMYFTTCLYCITCRLGLDKYRKLETFMDHIVRCKLFIERVDSLWLQRFPKRSSLSNWHEYCSDSLIADAFIWEFMYQRFLDNNIKVSNQAEAAMVTGS